MLGTKRWIIRSGLAVTLLLVPPSEVSGQQTAAEQETSAPVVALLPLANYSPSVTATALVTHLLERELTQNQFSIIDATELRTTLRRHRIRSVGSIDRPGAKALNTEVGADYLLLGSVDAFDDGDHPHLAFSLRLVEATSVRIVWAKSMAASGSDYITVLGLGEITSLDKLATRLVSEALTDLHPALIETTNRQLGGKAVALVPFDNLEPGSRAGDILTSRLLTALVRQDIEIVEPGEVSRLGRHRGRLSKGEIDLELLRLLADSLAADFVVTGTVDRLVRIPAGSEGAASQVALGARLLEARSGKIIAACELQHQTTNNGLLGSQSQSSIGRLLPPIIEKLIDELDLVQRTDFAKR